MERLVPSGRAVWISAGGIVSAIGGMRERIEAAVGEALRHLVAEPARDARRARRPVLRPPRRAVARGGVSKFSKKRGRKSRARHDRRRRRAAASSGGGRPAARRRSGRRRRGRARTSRSPRAPGPASCVDESCARTCAAAPPWRSTSTRTSSGPAGTGEQKCVFAEIGRSPGSPSSCLHRAHRDGHQHAARRRAEVPARREVGRVPAGRDAQAGDGGVGGEVVRVHGFSGSTGEERRAALAAIARSSCSVISNGAPVGRLSSAAPTPCSRHSASFSRQCSAGPQIAIASISSSLTAAAACLRSPVVVELAHQVGVLLEAVAAEERVVVDAHAADVERRPAA